MKNLLETTAREQLQRGDLTGATRTCNAILAQDSRHAEALYTMGVIALRQENPAGSLNFFQQAAPYYTTNFCFNHDHAFVLLQTEQPERALPLLQNILTTHPEFAQAHFLLGNCLTFLDRLHEAAKHYLTALNIKPDYPEAIFNLGETYRNLGRYSEAIDLFRQLSETPAGDTSETHFKLGFTLQTDGQHEAAIPSYRRAVEIAPTYYPACYNLGIALRECGRATEAISWLRKADELRPDSPVTKNNLGLALHEAGQHQEAILCFKQSLELQANYPEALSNWGNALLEKPDPAPQEAIVLYRRAIALDENFHEAWYNLGNAFMQLIEIEQAIVHYRHALTLKPDLVEAHWNLSHALLLAGQYREGFREYLWRWRRRQAAIFPIDRPHWRGQADPGLTLLIHTEQGLGDAIQFVRYVPLVRERVGRVFLACQPSLHTLFQSLPGVDAVFTKDNPHAVAPLVGAQVPLLDLPTIFATTTETIPADIPYLTADDKTILNATRLFPSDREALRVGLVWRGNPDHTNDRHRSCRFIDLEPLLDVPGVTFHSLQKDHQEKLPPAIIDLAPHLNTFADTAACLNQLDVIISVDTSVVHLAGALGKPVWVLLPKLPDWRWQLTGESTPWYPSMRLFRQQPHNDWKEVIKRITIELRMLAE